MRLRKNGVKRILRFADLSATAQLLIGLLNMGVHDVDEISRFIYADTPSKRERVIALLQELHTTKNRFIRRCVDYGLPPGCYSSFRADTQQSILCPLCRCRVSTVPCPACSTTGMPRRLVGDTLASDVKPKMPRYQTYALPGTLQKLRVFQAREARGEALFHPLDASFCDTMSRQGCRHEPE